MLLEMAILLYPVLLYCHLYGNLSFDAATILMPLENCQAGGVNVGSSTGMSGLGVGSGVPSTIQVAFTAVFAVGVKLAPNA